MTEADFWAWVDEYRALIIVFFVMLGSILWPKKGRGDGGSDH